MYEKIHTLYTKKYRGINKNVKYNNIKYNNIKNRIDDLFY